MAVSIVLAVGLVAWSLLGNLLLGETLYITRNVVLGVLVVVLLRRAGLGWPTLGLGVGHLRAGLRWGAVGVVLVTIVICAGLLAAGHVPGLDALFADQRADLSGVQLTWHVLWRVPIGTAVFEELVFRGALLGALLHHVSRLRAVVISSAVFGLWHVAPTIVTLQINDIAASSAEGLGAIVGAVAFTTIAGAVFAFLRLTSGSLLAPVLVHWATNSAGLLAAAIAQAGS